MTTLRTASESLEIDLAREGNARAKESETKSDVSLAPASVHLF